MRFQCQPGCVKCCEERGFVYLSERDVVRIAEHLHIPQAEFERRYLYRTKNQRRLRKPRNAECPFLSASGCMIHPIKPTQCSAFPVWPEIIESKKELAKTARWCPGIGKGRELSKLQIRAGCELMRLSYPHMYND